eukprot:TRINITY_DN556_c0_g1_i1.p1 TRINITY_DN556_c0_g1~~TRINITY_DN556_c0_g1_i1.p1  ORF type:complete len:132 (-),score=14.51 TRINITY_DN556_c0_g1_i1:43-438(-)
MTDDYDSLLLTTAQQHDLTSDDLASQFGLRSARPASSTRPELCGVCSVIVANFYASTKVCAGAHMTQASCMAAANAVSISAKLDASTVCRSLSLVLDNGVSQVCATTSASASQSVFVRNLQNQVCQPTIAC